MQRSKLPYFFLGLAAVLAISALVMLILRPGVKPTATPAPETSAPAVPPTAPPTEPIPPQNPETVLKDLGIGVTAPDPGTLVQQIAKALESGNPAAVGRLLGKDTLDPQTAERLGQLAAGNIRLRPNGIREVGEVELNARSRWVLELEGQQPGRDRIVLDLKRDGQNWSVEKVTLPPATSSAQSLELTTDSLGIADAFLQAVLSQKFEVARSYVEAAGVSDTKIAGLCILFEEGQYRMRPTKPLRAMFQRQDTIGYLAQVESTNGKQGAQFSLTMRQASGPASWRVAEINLDQLLADYAARVAGGDVYYSPLVRNPSGGETLALYFEFDEDAINPRTRRQLEIVSQILRADAGKKITLSGHTDSLGGPDYNNQLSGRRAEVVREFLIQAGVNATQVVTMAKGASQPRRPNVTESGADSPEGRRANRRTEIYLDF